MSNEQIEDRQTEISNIIEKRRNETFKVGQEEFDFATKWAELEKEFEPLYNESTELSALHNLQSNYRLIDMDDSGEYMSIEDFIECCKDGSFIDYDGFGYYCLDEMQTNLVIYPSHVLSKTGIRKDMDGVRWYNR